MIRQPPRTTLFPCPTLFRSRPDTELYDLAGEARAIRGVAHDRVRGENAHPQSLDPDPLPFVHPVYHHAVHEPLVHPGYPRRRDLDRKSTRLNSSHANISYAV